MKKIISLIMIFFISVMSVDAVTFIFDQNQVISDLKTDTIGFKVENVLSGSDNSYSLANFTGDLKLEIRDMENPVYFLIETTQANKTINISWVNDDAIDPINGISNIATIQELTLNEVGTYYFKFEPSFNGESIDFMVDLPPLTTMTSYTSEVIPKGFNIVFETFITALNGLITIIISLWTLFYYVIIIGLVLGMFFGMISIVFKFIGMAEEIKKKKNKLLSGKDRGK